MVPLRIDDFWQPIQSVQTVHALVFVWCGKRVQFLFVSRKNSKDFRIWVSPKPIAKPTAKPYSIRVLSQIKLKSTQKKSAKPSEFWYNCFIKNATISIKTEVLHMNDYSTLGHNMKRGIVNFSSKLSKEFNRPSQKFIADMLMRANCRKKLFSYENSAYSERRHRFGQNCREIIA